MRLSAKLWKFSWSVGLSATAKWLGTIVPRTPIERCWSISRRRRLPISTGLNTAAEGLGEHTLDQTLEPTLELLQTHWGRSLPRHQQTTRSTAVR